MTTKTKHMTPPSLSHLQFLVLTTLLSGEQYGRHLRERIADIGESKSGPAFYQMMGRLERSRYVEGWHEQQVVNGQMLRERKYRMTDEGWDAWRGTRDFYLRLIRETCE